MARSTLWKHRKFRRLVMELKNKALAVGVLECMWSCGYDSGDDLLGSAKEVEVAAGWAGKRGALVPILESIGWIDATPDGYRIHDLYDHAPEYVQRRRRRELQRGQRTDTDRTLTGQRTDTDPNSPTRTRTRTPQPTPLPLAQSVTGRERTSVQFENFWAIYPRKEAMGAASRAWVEHVSNGDGEKIMSALKWQVLQERWTEDNGRWVPKPEKYLRDRMWLDSPAANQPTTGDPF